MGIGWRVLGWVDGGLCSPWSRLQAGEAVLRRLARMESVVAIPPPLPRPLSRKGRGVTRAGGCGVILGYRVSGHVKVLEYQV